MRRWPWTRGSSCRRADLSIPQSLSEAMRHRFQNELKSFQDEIYVLDGVLLLDASTEGFEVTALVCDPFCRHLPVVVRVRWPGMPFLPPELEVVHPPCRFRSLCDTCPAWRFTTLLVLFQAEFSRSGFGSPWYGLWGAETEGPYGEESLQSLERAVSEGASCVCTFALRRALEARGCGPSVCFLREVRRNFWGKRNAATDFVKTVGPLRISRELYGRSGKATTPGRLPKPLRELVASYAFFPDLNPS